MLKGADICHSKRVYLGTMSVSCQNGLICHSKRVYLGTMSVVMQKGTIYVIVKGSICWYNVCVMLKAANICQQKGIFGYNVLCHAKRD